MSSIAKKVRKLEKAIAKGSTKKIAKRSDKLANALNQLSPQQQSGLLSTFSPAVSNLLGARGLLQVPEATAGPVFNPQLQQQLGLLGSQPAGGTDINSLIDQFLSGLMPQSQNASQGLGNVADRLFTPRAGASFIPPGAFAPPPPTPAGSLGLPQTVVPPLARQGFRGQDISPFFGGGQQFAPFQRGLLGVR